ncbi:hypothetical protein NMG60_11015289 [Bertholletia excelsa]
MYKTKAPGLKIGPKICLAKHALSFRCWDRLSSGAHRQSLLEQSLSKISSPILVRCKPRRQRNNVRLQSPAHAAPLLFKQHSWSPDIARDEAWSRRKDNHRRRLRRRCKSVTDDDLNELKACFELGFGFDPDSPKIDPKLSDAFPALHLYCAVNRQYISRSSSEVSDADTASLSAGSPGTIFELGIEPEKVKTRLKQWAQVVACAVRQSPPPK